MLFMYPACSNCNKEEQESGPLLTKGKRETDKMPQANEIERTPKVTDLSEKLQAVT